jgi:ubiquinone/menaquinone biosynthesis C-methylase UbiE
MDVKKLLFECKRVLRSGGKLTIADVGGSSLMKVPVINFLFRLVVFSYFFLYENKSRAWAESRAVSNVLSKDDWNLLLENAGFRDILIRELKSKYFWIPAPLLIKAEK